MADAQGMVHALPPSLKSTAELSRIDLPKSTAQVHAGVELHLSTHTRNLRTFAQLSCSGRHSRQLFLEREAFTEHVFQEVFPKGTQKTGGLREDGHLVGGLARVHTVQIRGVGNLQAGEMLGFVARRSTEGGARMAMAAGHVSALSWRAREAAGDGFSLLACGQDPLACAFVFHAAKACVLQKEGDAVWDAMLQQGSIKLVVLPFAFYGLYPDQQRGVVHREQLLEIFPPSVEAEALLQHPPQPARRQRGGLPAMAKPLPKGKRGVVSLAARVEWTEGQPLHPAAAERAVQELPTAVVLDPGAQDGEPKAAFTRAAVY
ncbi:hypothetical protein ABPG75_000801 [Micractinium tetrahymenae]